jgi:hypothetical protein
MNESAKLLGHKNILMMMRGPSIFVFNDEMGRKKPSLCCVDLLPIRLNVLVRELKGGLEGIEGERMIIL